ncbi:MAG: hypothetical protein K0R65_2024 [Crocinitomicaceae bacterium]|jgi:hypothetical protein|nr:hypothetical protein [Crocinitomicaceae bacterium]
MKKILFLALVSIQFTGFSQIESLDLKNVLVVGQLDKPEDRFTVEVNMTEILAEQGIKTMASLNVLKQGAEMITIASDSVAAVLKAKGIDTYVLVSVRGYDTRFKPSKNHNDLKTELTTGHLFPLYRDETVSVTLEFNFYRNGQFVAYDILKLPGTSSRDEVIKKLHKKLPKRINKLWK